MSLRSHGRRNGSGAARARLVERAGNREIAREPGRWRLQLAARHLRTNDLSMGEIADAVGYGSEASFSKAFKRHVGVSPGGWRGR